MKKSHAMRWLSLWLPRLPTDRLQREKERRPSGPHSARHLQSAPEGARSQPLALYAKEANAFVLTAVDARAQRAGLHAGMTLSDARAIRPDLFALEAEPEKDACALDAIAAWCERFTPVVALDPPSGLFLDITGCAHLFGGEETLRTELVTRLSAQGFHARAAIAPTPGAAWAWARFTNGANTAATFSSLPVSALRLDPEATALLKRLGLKTIGQLQDAPRSSFTARTGERAMLRLDQALGQAREALTPRRPPPPVTALRRFLEPIFTADAVLLVAERLVADVIVQLDRRGMGALRALLHLYGVDGRDRSIEFRFSRPERDAKAMLRIFRERLNIAAETLDMEFGVEAARLDIVELQRLENALRTLVAAEEAAASAEKITALVDVLSARLGAKRVLVPQFRNAHAPERAGAWESALVSSPACGGGVAEGDGGGSCISPLGHHASRADSSPVNGGAFMRRPLTLFTRPQPIEAIAEVPDGPPARFRWRRVLREVARAEGPERIAGDWLKQEPTRDYYRVEDKEGRRYWLYREGFYGAQAPRWFMHGLFA